MAATCARPTWSFSVKYAQQSPSYVSALQQASAVVRECAMKCRKRLVILASDGLSTPSGTVADNAVKKNSQGWTFLPAMAGFLAADLASVSPAGALDENDAVRQYEALIKGTSSVVDTVTADGGDAIASVTTGLGDDALVIGAVALFAVAGLALIARLLNKGYAGKVSAKEALRLLEEDATSVLIDIRSSQEISEEGSPKLAGGKKVVRIQYLKESDGIVSEDDAFVGKVEAKSAAKDAAVYVIDKTGSDSVAAAKSLAQAGFTKAFVVSGGTDAWQASELPWLKPTSFVLDLAALREAIDVTVKENPNVVPATLGLAAATAGSLLLFSEAETALQLLGSAAVAQLVIKKFLFAEDRKKTIEQLKSFLDTKVAPQELVDEIKDIGNALLPNEATSETTSATSESNGSASSTTSESNGSASSPTSDSISRASSTREAAIAPVAAEASESSEFSQSSTPLSAYTAYPELRPPASPKPAKPPASPTPAKQ